MQGELRVSFSRGAKLDHEIALLKDSNQQVLSELTRLKESSAAETTSLKDQLLKRERQVEKAIEELKRLDAEKSAIGSDRSTQLARNSELKQLNEELELSRQTRISELEGRIIQLNKELVEVGKSAEEKRGKDQREFNKKLQVMQNRVMDLEKAKKETVTQFNNQIKENVTLLQQAQVKLFQQRAEEQEKANNKSTKAESEGSLILKEN